MKIIQTILPLFFTLLLMASCGSNDEPDCSNGLYDWDVTETVLVRKTGERNSTNYVEYNKTEEYMHQQKISVEGKSNKYYGWLYIYNRRN